MTGSPQFSARVRRGTGGVAHIDGDSWADLGYGQGWAIACDHLPTIADQIVKVRSERASFHGAGPMERHLASDLGYLVLGIDERAIAFRDAQPTHLADLVRGYTAGYNRRVDQVLEDPDLLPRWCRAAPWIRRIDELDLYRYLVDVSLMGSGRNLAPLIGWARPPGADGPFPAPSMDALAAPVGASNGWAFGRDATASGGGMVFANPHFPWTGEARFWECHLRIPGELDVYGVSLLGAPGIQMGFNRHLGWAHTFSRGHRFTVYQQALDPDDATAYRYGDEVRAMSSQTYSVTVLDGDGESHIVEREMFRTHHGPMVALPLLGWGEQVAFSYRDANLDNTAVLQQFMGMATAATMDEFKDVFSRFKGMPWVNTLAADEFGNAWYTDASATPNLSPEASERFRNRLETDLVAAMAYEARIAMLDGSEPGDEWVDAGGARSPGLVPAEQLPAMDVTDVAVNANDSHWAPHPQRRLEGYPVLCGLERVPLSLRSRANLRTAAALVDRGVTADAVVRALYSSEGLSSELLREQVVARCTDHEDPAVRDAARVLQHWDGTVDLDASGAVLWREFMYGFPDAAWRQGSGLFATGFDPYHALSTPKGLMAPPTDPSQPDPVIDAVRAAITALEAAGLHPAASPRDAQWVVRGDERIAVPGGDEGEGVINVMTPLGALASSSLEPVSAPSAPIAGRERSGLAQGGYQETYGTSFLMVLELTPEGPTGHGLLAYGQCGDPRSPHHADGTRAFAEADLRELRFAEERIVADPALSTVELVEGTPINPGSAHG